MMAAWSIGFSVTECVALIREIKADKSGLGAQAVSSGRMGGITSEANTGFLHFASTLVEMKSV
jgi:hypothetical protein